MKKINLKIFLIHLLVVTIIFFLDRITKIYILNLAGTNGNVDIIVNDFLNIILVWNSGVGFGLLSFEKDLIYNLITTLIIFIDLVIIYFIINSNNLKRCFFIMILGGSLGNLYDRIYYSAVPDFIDLNYNNFHWFVFNVADIFISIGIGCLIFVELFFNKSDIENEK